MLGRGSLAIAADLAGREALAARIGFGVLAGVPRTRIEDWAARSLALRDPALHALARLGAGGLPLDLLVLSRGTPAIAVAAFLARADVRARLASAGVRGEPRVHAPAIEEHDGVLTGRVTSGLESKAERLRHIPAGAVFLGDRRDQRQVSKLVRTHFRFERV
jgi:hypothetical protein